MSAGHGDHSDLWDYIEGHRDEIHELTQRIHALEEKVKALESQTAAALQAQQLRNGGRLGRG